MSTTSTVSAPPPTTVARLVPHSVGAPDAATARAHRIGFGRIVGVEMRKTFDTRAGLWLMVAILAAATVATGAVMLWAPDDALTYETFGTAIGMPMAVLLPVVSILSVTSEWSQRSGLTTFTLVPRRSRTIAAKAVVTVVVGVVSMALAIGIGALGTLLGATLRGLDPVFDLSGGQLGTLVLAQVLGMFVGFMLGVLTRSSAVALVSYFVFWGLLPALSQTLYALQDWYRDVVGWVDFGWAHGALYDGGLTGTEWAQLAVTGTGWLLLPTLVGLWMLMRSEIS